MLEIDEDSHANRDVSCELAKLDETRHAAEAGTKPAVTIRYNPDTYDCRSVSTTERQQKLVETIKRYQTCPIEDLATNGANVVFMFYHTKAHKHIAAAVEASESVSVLGVIS